MSTEYNLYVDELIQVWRRTYMTVEANDTEEAIDLCLNGHGDITETEYLYDTEEGVESNSEPTTEVYTEEDELLYSDDPKVYDYGR